MQTDDSIFIYKLEKTETEEKFLELFPNADKAAISNAGYAAYEIEIGGYWTEDGKFYATSLNGVGLSKATKI